MKYEKQFDSLVFFGSPSCYRRMIEVHGLVDKIAVLMGGLQQPDHSSSPEGAEAARMVRTELEGELKAMQEDLATALGFSYAE